MTCQQTQELYSDYAESALAPAQVAAMSQHLQACAACKADYEVFQKVTAFLSEPLPEIDTPRAFATNVMARIAAQAPDSPAATIQRQSLGERLARIWGRFAQGLAATPQRAFVTGVACTLIAVAVFSGLRGLQGGAILHPVSAIKGVSAEMWPVPVEHTSGILQNVNTETQGGRVYHVFGIHLPLGTPAAQVQAYVLQNGSGLIDDAALNNTDNATPVWSGTAGHGESVHIPVAVVAGAQPGTTLNFLVAWSPQNDGAPDQDEAAFVPISQKPAAPAPLNAGDSLYDALQNISSTYNVTIFADPSAVNSATQAAAQGTSGLGGLTGAEGSAQAALQTVLTKAGYYITQQSDGSFLVTHA